MEKCVYLCGFMGCGKSYIGRILEDMLQIPLIDLDSYISLKEELSIPQIFHSHGEEYFRKTEADCIREIKGAIVATGGGALINKETAEYCKKNGIVFFLNVSFRTCYKRIKGDKRRPIAFNSTKEELLTLYQKRKIIYKENSDYTINANASGKNIALEIMKFIKVEGLL